MMTSDVCDDNRSHSDDSIRLRLTSTASLKFPKITSFDSVMLPTTFGCFLLMKRFFTMQFFNIDIFCDVTSIYCYSGQQRDDVERTARSGDRHR